MTPSSPQTFYFPVGQKLLITNIPSGSRQTSHLAAVISSPVARRGGVLQSNTRSRRSSTAILDQTVLHRAGYTQKTLRYVNIILGRALKKVYTKFLRQFLSLLRADNLLIQHIALVPHENLVHGHVCMLINLSDPVADRLKRPAVGHVVNKQNSLRAAEIRGGNSAESLLPRRVPNLQLDSFSVDLHVLNLEVDADGGDKCGGEGVIGVTQEQARFTDAGVADHEQFTLHVIGGCIGHGYGFVVEI
mmetsp:Transcript_9415/g.21249  ORF Transcript_9415/g.21249 Transcript_9415/m.21249 type:complete len:246 (-) Transcript_9415:98-835(-)